MDSSCLKNEIGWKNMEDSQEWEARGFWRMTHEEVQQGTLTGMGCGCSTGTQV